jgi:5-methylcytosine-specific restriction endonuclease McrA
MPARTGRPWQRIKARVIRRDGGICHLCGQPGADSADHLVPYSQGGTNTMDNLRAVHHDVEPRCNRARGNGSILATRAKLTAADPQGWDW